jgi:hypothetical protein
MIRDITPELESLLDQNVEQAMSWSKFTNLKNAQFNVGYARTAVNAPHQSDVAAYLDESDLSADDVAAIKESAVFLRLMDFEEVHPNDFLSPRHFVELWLWDRGRFLDVAVDPRVGVSTWMCRDLLDSDWLLGEPLGFDELTIIRELQLNLFLWRSIPMKEFIHSARRNRLLSFDTDTYGTTNDYMLALGRDSFAQEWRKICEPDAALSWSLLNFGPPTRRSKYSLDEQMSVVSYGYDAVSAYVGAGIYDPKVITKFIEDGIDPSLASSLITAK